MPKRLPRFSLLSLLFVTAIIGLTIALWRSRSELVDLRQEVTQRRAEMGQLFITDESKPHAIGVDWDNHGNWKWRLYTPPRSNLTLFRFVGNAPAKPDVSISNSSWLRKLGTGEIGQGRRTQGGLQSGEFTFNLQFEQEDDQWYFWTEGPQWRDEIPKEFSRWMSKRNRWYPASSVSSRRQLVFDLREPIMLLCVQEINDMGTDGKAGDTIVLWIDVDR